MLEKNPRVKTPNNLINNLLRWANIAFGLYHYK